MVMISHSRARGQPGHAIERARRLKIKADEISHKRAAPRHPQRAHDRAPLTSQGLKEDEDRVKYQSKAAEYGADGVRGSLRVGNQIEKCEAHDQEDEEPLDPRHVELPILSVFTADYSSTLLAVQAEAPIPDPSTVSFPGSVCPMAQDFGPVRRSKASMTVWQTSTP
jgi:hypothetical protein